MAFKNFFSEEIRAKLGIVRVTEETGIDQNGDNNYWGGEAPRRDGKRVEIHE